MDDANLKGRRSAPPKLAQAPPEALFRSRKLAIVGTTLRCEPRELVARKTKVSIARLRPSGAIACLQARLQPSPERT